MKGILEWLASDESQSRVDAWLDKALNIFLGILALGCVGLVVAQIMLGMVGGK